MVLDRSRSLQKRALFYVFDGGTGIGHLRRIANISKRLQGRFACLIVTGHRAPTQWFIPEDCEYVRLPSWDSLIEERAKYWGRLPFIELSKAAAVRLRMQILKGVVSGFQPDLMFVDHLPLGAEKELSIILRNKRCRNYLITRGVLNETENLRQLILGGEANDYLRMHYHKILVAADPRVFDFSQQYNISPDIQRKTIHTGYVAESVSTDVIAKARKDRGLAANDIWVVASAGGGQLGEGLIEKALELAKGHQDIIFDIVLGPRSSLHWHKIQSTTISNGKLRLQKEIAHLPLLHASADLVISSGGYNSLLEALQGRAKILCFPLRKDQRDEQYRHAARLKKFVDIDLSTDLADLPALFERSIRTLREGIKPDRRSELDFDGATKIEKIVLDDLELPDEY